MKLTKKQGKFVKEQVYKISQLKTIYEIEKYTRDLYMANLEKPAMHWLNKAIDLQEQEILTDLNKESALVVRSELRAGEA